MPKRKEKSARAGSGKTSTQQETILCDFSFPRVLEDLRDLSNENWSSLKSVRARLEQMTWQQAYDQVSRTAGEKRGVNLERIAGQLTSDGSQIYSIRINAAFRARVVRRDRRMRFISLHIDHDSTYREPGGEEL